MGVRVTKSHGLPWEMFSMRGPRAVEVEGTTSDALRPLTGYLESGCPLGPPWPKNPVYVMVLSEIVLSNAQKGFLPVRQPKVSRAPNSTTQTLNPKPSTLNPKP